MVETKQVADALLTAAVVGIGVVVGGPVAAVVGGIGINWASELTRKGWEQACCQLVGKRGPRNHDLQQAMARGFENAINGIEQGWWQTTRGNQIRRQEPESAKAIKESFKLLREEAQALFVDDQQERTSS
ncbi:MAG: hypothetical protein FJZ88_04485, partial [Chloroflexi bacterium]|nr:hypothetical protein [Chloroflexota bacterium]